LAVDGKKGNRNAPTSKSKTLMQGSPAARLSARDAALTVLREFRQGRDLRSALNDAVATVSDARERGLTTQLALGVVRNMTLLDYYIAAASSIPMRKVEPRALDILQVAVYQLAFLDKIPASAAVSEAVSAARRKLNPRAVSYINAVLRKLAAELPPVVADDEAERLAVLYSHPAWLVREVMARLGEAETEQWLTENNAEPPIYARVNTLKATASQVVASLEERGVAVTANALDGTLELRGTGEIKRLKAFRDGWFYVQDPSSTRAAHALGFAESGTVGETDREREAFTVIDACAAPGGKSFAAAIAMENRGRVLSFDTEKKISLIDDGAKRLGITIVEARAGDSSEHNAELVEIADRVLVDAPCSGFGVIRKKPEIRFKSADEVAALPALQLRILSNCAAYVKRGGTLVYSTCTVLQRENEDVVATFLAKNADFALDSQTTLWTQRDGGDGFFYAVMRRATA